MYKRSREFDAKLVNQFRIGNKDALNELVKRWHRQFCNKAYWLVKDADLAKDIAQDSWTTIISKIDALKDAESFGNWALRIVYSKSLDALRALSKEREKKLEYVKDEAEINLETVDNSELEKRLLQKIKELPEHQQMVIKLFYVEEYSLKEISKILNINVGTVKSRLFHAREKLKQTLKNRNYEN